SVPLGFGDEPLLLGFGQGLNALTLDLGLFQHSRDKLFFTTVDLGLLYFDLLFLFDLLDLHLLGHHLLLHVVGLDVIGFIGLRLLPFRDFQELGFLDLEIARRLSLLRHRKGFCQDALLIGLRLGDRSFALRQRTLDRVVTISFRGSNIRVTLDARDVGLAHVGDVFVLVTDLFNGEGNHLETHLVHVVGAGGTHAVSNHLRLLHDFFHCELSDDAAQMPFHDQPDESFALLVSLGKELFRRSQNGLHVGFHFDLRHGFDGDRHALLGVEVLLRRDIKRHQLQRKSTANLNHRKHDGAVSFHDSGSAEPVNYQCFMWSSLAVQACQRAHQEHGAEHDEYRYDPYGCNCPKHNRLLRNSFEQKRAVNKPRVIARAIVNLHDLHDFSCFSAVAVAVRLVSANSPVDSSPATSSHNRT